MPPSRRRVLHVADGLTARLAGCADVGDPAVDRPATVYRSEPVRLLTAVDVRSEATDPLFASADGDARGATH